MLNWHQCCSLLSPPPPSPLQQPHIVCWNSCRNAYGRVKTPMGMMNDWVLYVHAVFITHQIISLNIKCCVVWFVLKHDELHHISSFNNLVFDIMIFFVQPIDFSSYYNEYQFLWASGAFSSHSHFFSPIFYHINFRNKCSPSLSLLVLLT